MLAAVNPSALPALRIAAMFLFMLNICAVLISFAIAMASSSGPRTSTVMRFRPCPELLRQEIQTFVCPTVPSRSSEGRLRRTICGSALTL